MGKHKQLRATMSAFPLTESGVLPVHILLVAVAMAAIGMSAQAQETPVSEMSTEEFIQQLAPPLLRTRGVSVTPRVNMAVTFEFGSAELTEDAQSLLDNLGTALRSPELLGQRYRLNGHTDAVGAEEDNYRLSLLRANAVRDYLNSIHDIDRNRLETEGFGEIRLIEGLDPEDGQNRRVEIELLD